MDKDCYFSVRDDAEPGRQTIQATCVDCARKLGTPGWFWQGTVLGYGPWEFTCNRCGVVIHEAPRGHVRSFFKDLVKRWHR